MILPSLHMLSIGVKRSHEEFDAVEKFDDVEALQRLALQRLALQRLAKWSAADPASEFKQGACFRIWGSSLQQHGPCCWLVSAAHAALRLLMQTPPVDKHKGSKDRCDFIRFIDGQMGAMAVAGKDMAASSEASKCDCERLMNIQQEVGGFWNKYEIVCGVLTRGRGYGSNSRMQLEDIESKGEKSQVELPAEGGYAPAALVAMAWCLGIRFAVTDISISSDVDVDELQAQLAAVEKAGMVEEAVVIKHKLRKAVSASIDAAYEWLWLPEDKLTEAKFAMSIESQTARIKEFVTSVRLEEGSHDITLFVNMYSAGGSKLTKPIENMIEAHAGVKRWFEKGQWHPLDVQVKGYIVRITSSRASHFLLVIPCTNADGDTTVAICNSWNIGCFDAEIIGIYGCFDEEINKEEVADVNESCHVHPDVGLEEIEQLGEFRIEDITCIASARATPGS